MYQSKAEERNFRWLYAALVALAIQFLDKMNREREHPNDWPAGQTWEGLSGSSKDIFMQQAREAAGIPKRQFLALVRGEYMDDEYINAIYTEGPKDNTLFVTPAQYTETIMLAAGISNRSCGREWTDEDEAMFVEGLRRILDKPDLEPGPYNVRIQPEEVKP